MREMGWSGGWIGRDVVAEARRCQELSIGMDSNITSFLLHRGHLVISVQSLLRADESIRSGYPALLQCLLPMDSPHPRAECASPSSSNNLPSYSKKCLSINPRAERFDNAQ